MVRPRTAETSVSAMNLTHERVVWLRWLDGISTSHFRHDAEFWPLRTHGKDIGVVYNRRAEQSRWDSTGHGGGRVHGHTKSEARRCGHRLRVGGHVARVHLEFRSVGVLQLLRATVEEHRSRAAGE